MELEEYEFDAGRDIESEEKRDQDADRSREIAIQIAIEQPDCNCDCDSNESALEAAFDCASRWESGVWHQQAATTRIIMNVARVARKDPPLVVVAANRPISHINSFSDSSPELEQTDADLDAAAIAIGPFKWSLGCVCSCPLPPPLATSLPFLFLSRGI